MQNKPKEREKREKRDNGDGSIVLRSDGRWMASIQNGVKENGLYASCFTLWGVSNEFITL